MQVSGHVDSVCVVCSEVKGWGRGRTGGVRNLCLYLLSLLEPSGGDGVALLVLQQLLRCLQKLVANVALKHSRDEMDLEVPFVHAARLAHKITEYTLKTWKRVENVPDETGRTGLCVWNPHIPFSLRVRCQIFKKGKGTSNLDRANSVKSYLATNSNLTQVHAGSSQEEDEMGFKGWTINK